MKYCRFIAVFIAVLILMECTAHKKLYQFPSEMSESVQADFDKQCEKGQILYSINCASCHNTKVRGKEIIPDFSPEQLKGYELRVLNPDHESGIPEENISPEELGLIMTFLSYKKKNTPMVKK